MKVKVELDLTTDEAKELFVPGDKQTDFMNKIYEAYMVAMSDMVMSHVNPFSSKKT